MSSSMGNAFSRAVGRSAVAIIGVLALSACDRPGAFDPAGQESGLASRATFPTMVGDYNGTAVANLRASIGSRTYRCSGRISIASQTAGSFSGTFAVQQAGDCDQASGTVAGMVELNGSVTLTADLEGGGADVWEDAAVRTGCRLVSRTPFTGTASGGTVSLTGTGVYDCPLGFGQTARVNADVQITATRP